MADYSALINYVSMIGCVCKEKEPMSAHTSFAIGGPADLFIETVSKAALGSLISACRKWEIPYFILGNGSNLLVSDSGIEGAVIHLSGGLSDMNLIGAYEIECGAGIKLSRLCTFAHENSLSGMEFAWGIPGTAGGAAYMNAGAYGSEMKNVLVGCSHISSDGSEGERAGDELLLDYRRSAYTDSGEVITSLRVHLKPGDPEEIRDKMDELIKRRKEKQPLEFPSAGSTFKRPQGGFAGTLIEQCGLKGCSIGGAQVSDKHAGFIINTGGATCSDVRRLMEHIQKEVFMQTSIHLEPEVKIIGAN